MACVVFVMRMFRVNECDGEAKVTWIFTSKAHESTAQIKAHQVSKSSGQQAAHRCPPLCVFEWLHICCVAAEGAYVYFYPLSLRRPFWVLALFQLLCSH